MENNYDNVPERVSKAKAAFKELPYDDRHDFAKWATENVHKIFIERKKQREDEPDIYDAVAEYRKKHPESVQPMHWIDKIPIRLKEALVRYRDHGRPTGDCLRALLSNNLREYVARADQETWSVTKELLWWIQRFIPGEAWGDPVYVDLWIKVKGLEGEERIRGYWSKKVENELRELGRESEV